MFINIVVGILLWVKGYRGEPSLSPSDAQPTFEPERSNGSLNSVNGSLNVVNGSQTNVNGVHEINRDKSNQQGYIK